MRSIYSEIANSKASGKSDNIRDGVYRFAIVKAICEDMNEGPTVVIEFKVLSSASKGDLDPVTKQPVVPNAVGSTCSVVWKLKKHKSAFGNTKAFVLALFGQDEADVTPTDLEKTLDQLFSKAQPARGMVIAAETYQSATKSGPNAGKVNTYPRFKNVPQTGDDVKAMKAQLDAASADTDEAA